MSTTEAPGMDAGQYQPPPDQAEYARFQAAQAYKARIDEAMRGNGSDNAFVRWLTRKPLPIKMTANRVICGIIWAFWTFVGLLGMILAPGGGHFGGFLIAALAGFYTWRIFTKRATSLWFFIVW